jgi:hypothetical protein
LRIRENKISLLFSVLAVFSVCVGVFVFRDFETAINPAIYTEDGIWMHYLEKNPFDILGTRRDYFIVGNMLLLHAAHIILSVFFQNSLFFLPQAIAIASWLFFGCMACIPFWLMREHFSFITRLLIVAFICVLPIGDYPQFVLGRISNVGYLFYVLAFWIVLYLKFSPHKHWPQQLAYLTPIMGYKSVDYMG